MTERTLGNALEALGERQKDAKIIEQAVRVMSGAVEVYQLAGEGYWLPIAQERLAEMQTKLAELKH
jgi:hypothetical protein